MRITGHPELPGDRVELVGQLLFGGLITDAERGALVKAFVVLAAGYDASSTLIEELQLHVRGKLAPYEYPKEIEFIGELPMTTTGKVQRRVLRELEKERANKST